MSEFPAPLTPPDCDLRDFGFMPLDVVRLRDSDLAALATGDEFRAAVLLWCASWHQQPAASLPKEPSLIARLAGFGRDLKAWERVSAGALRGWIECADGRLYHPVIAEKAIEAWAAKLAQRARTAAATAARQAAAEERRRLRDADRQEDRNGPRNDNRDDQHTDDRNVHQGTGTGIGTVEVKEEDRSVVPPDSEPAAAAPSAAGRSPAKGKDYAYEGDVLRISRPDWAKLEASAPNLCRANGLTAAVAKLDAHYAGEPAEKRGNPWFRCRQAIANMDIEAGDRQVANGRARQDGRL